MAHYSLPHCQCHCTTQKRIDWMLNDALFVYKVVSVTFYDVLCEFSQMKERYSSFIFKMIKCVLLFSPVLFRLFRVLHLTLDFNHKFFLNDSNHHRHHYHKWFQSIISNKHIFRRELLLSVVWNIVNSMELMLHVVMWPLDRTKCNKPLGQNGVTVCVWWTKVRLSNSINLNCPGPCALITCERFLCDTKQTALQILARVLNVNQHMNTCAEHDIAVVKWSFDETLYTLFDLFLEIMMIWKPVGFRHCTEN